MLNPSGGAGNRTQCTIASESVQRGDTIANDSSAHADVGSTQSRTGKFVSTLSGPEQGPKRKMWTRSGVTANGQKNGTAEYRAWIMLRQRCHNPRARKFPDYGGRGIRVCERWMDFAAFLADMGPKPSPAHSIDRVNNDGNYEPGNCRWATPKEQSNNRRPRRAL